MTLRESLRLMRRWRSLMATGIVIGVVVGWVSAPGNAAPTSSYQATHTLIVEPRAGGNALIYRAAPLATLGAVPDRVASRLGLDRGSVRSMVSVEIPTDVAVVKTMSITGRSGDPARAEALADVTAEELIVELGGDSTPLRTLEPASATPVERNDIRGPASRPGRALLCGGFGLLLGVGAVFAVDRFDNRIRSRGAAEDALGAPVLAEAVPIPHSEQGRLVTPTTQSPFIEAHRGLRTALDRWTDQTGGGDDHRVILVTAPTGGEGTTTTVAHLAVILAEAGRSVLAVSADLHRPRLHVYFERRRDPGFVDVLVGGPDAPTLDDLDLGTPIPGVHLLASGAPVGNPAPLLEGAGDLLIAARHRYDFVVVDSPPLLGTSDAAELSRHADAVLLVLRAGRTALGAASRSAELLHRLDVPILGAVLVAGVPAPVGWRAPWPRPLRSPVRR